MTPEDRQPYPDFGMRLFEYFFGNPPPEDSLGEKYLRRGLIPTNNLRTYITDNPEAEIEGYPNPWDYRKKPYKDVIERFRDENQDLWQEEIESNGELTSRQAARRAGEMDDPTLSQAYDEQYWAHAAVCDRVFRVLGPMLIEAGYDPIDICK